MPFELKILGSTSATPILNRHQSAQVLTIEQKVFLIDCGESTQHQLLKYKIKINKIESIFISHLHGDHYLGLVGLLSTMHLQGRVKELHLYAPSGLNDIITLQFKISETIINYNIIYHEIKTEISQIIFEDNLITIETLPLKHRIACSGFIFREKPKKIRLKKESIPADMSLQNLAQLRHGQDVLNEHGEVVFRFVDFALPPKNSRSYAYCSDTIYDESIVDIIKNVDLLYHEATFLDNLRDRAKITFHTTAKEAATIAKLSGVKRLIIGHFSSRYKDLLPLLEEAKETFSNTNLAIEGTSYSIED